MALFIFYILAKYVVRDDILWLYIINGVFGCFGFILWILFPTGLLTSSYLFVTNQRIGYYRKILEGFELPPKWLNLNEGHLICGTLYYWPSIAGLLLGCDTKEKVLKNAYLGLRLDRYDHLHQRINLKLSVINSIYLLELIKLISNQTKVVLYVAPIMYPKGNQTELLVNYRFRGSQLEDLQHFFKTIDWTGILQAKNKKYGGKTNMDRLASFFKTTRVPHNW